MKYNTHKKNPKNNLTSSNTTQTAANNEQQKAGNIESTQKSKSQQKSRSVSAFSQEPN